MPDICISVSRRGQRVAGRVGVERGERAVVAGVHGLEHVQHLVAADLADDDAVGAHTQGVAHQVARRDLALAFDVRRARLQAHDVRLLELELGRVLDGDDALVGRDEARQDVEQRRLARAGAARDQDVEPRLHDALEDLRHGLGDGPLRDAVLHGQRLHGEAADRQERAVERQRRDDGVDARAVRQAGVDVGRSFVDAAADARHDAVDDDSQVGRRGT